MLTRSFPAIPLSDGTNLWSLLSPATLVGYVQSQVLAPNATLQSQLACTTNLLPTFTTEQITADGFLQPLSQGACGGVASVPGNSYLVGALSTKVLGASNLTAQQQQEAESAKQDAAQDYAVCLALDPCSLDFYLGFDGLSVSWPVPLTPLPPAEASISLNGLAYSVNVGAARGLGWALRGVRSCCRLR